MSLPRLAPALACIALAVAICLPAAAQAPTGPPLTLRVDNSPLSPRVKQETSSATMVQAVSPSVVRIFTAKIVGGSQMPERFNDPMFKRFFDERFGQESQRIPSLGSGVIVSANGYIITNNHVIEDADEIKVAVDSMHREYTAVLVGTDPKTDVALLKVEATDLPPITLADSDLVEVGDQVFAIGNPMGVGQTVTSGIVSALGRGDLGITDYENFIQTDAAINRGNSGGALVDAQGRLVGMNTAIVSSTGGSQGIGLAVPSNLVGSVIERIRKHGRVVRGYLGVVIQPVTPELAEAFGVKPVGVLVSDLTADSSGAEAGIQRGDVIISYAGKPVKDVRHLRLLVERTPPREKIPVQILRAGRAATLQVELKELPDDGTATQSRPPTPPEPETDSRLGVDVGALSPDLLRQLGAPAELRGVVVTTVLRNSPAELAGLRRYDVIREIDRTPVSTLDDAVAVIKAKGNERLLLYIWRRGEGSRWYVIAPR